MSKYEDKFADAIREQTKTIKEALAVHVETNAQIRDLGRRLDRIEKQNDISPERTGKAVGAVLNQAASRGSRR